MESTSNVIARSVVEQLQHAINAHDLEALVLCFSPDVESMQPVHPARAFQGREQIRRNWRQILGGIPDLHANLLGCVVQGPSVWTEWQWVGTRTDGQPFEMRGMTVQEVGEDGSIAKVRLYMEPVDRDGSDVATAVREIAGPTTTTTTTTMPKGTPSR